MTVLLFWQKSREITLSESRLLKEKRRFYKKSKNRAVGHAPPVRTKIE